MTQFQAVPTTKGSFQVRLRIAIDSGALFVSEVGDHLHTELVVTGQLINRIVQAQAHAAPGEVIIGAATLAALPQASVQPATAGLYVLHNLHPQVARVVPRVQQHNDEELPPTLATVRTLLKRIGVVRPFVPAQLPERFLAQGRKAVNFAR